MHAPQILPSRLLVHAISSVRKPGYTAGASLGRRQRISSPKTTQRGSDPPLHLLRLPTLRTRIRGEASRKGPYTAQPLICESWTSRIDGIETGVQGKKEEPIQSTTKAEVLGPACASPFCFSCFFFLSLPSPSFVLRRVGTGNGKVMIGSDILKFGCTAGYRQVESGLFSGGLLDKVVKRRSGFDAEAPLGWVCCIVDPSHLKEASRHGTMCRGNDALPGRVRNTPACQGYAKIGDEETKEKSHDHDVSGDWCGFGGGSRLA
ncbi:hypothetical protein M0657_005073 [Pyricularia oryzae]|nr:hypothetical protein M9X92_006458 [Pyricularia oryzae]KAI7923608.1 hypothetical protein M0657_005073 [Pyricularia oryzae]